MKHAKEVTRTTLVMLAVAIAIAGALLLGHWEKGIPKDLTAAMILIQKLENPDTILLDCQFDSSGDLSECDNLLKRLEPIKSGDEEIFATPRGELVGVNFSNHVVVLIRPRKRPDGRISFSCSVWPQKAAPLGCRRAVER